MTPAQKREILHLRGRGMGYAQIAKVVGLPAGTVKSFCWRSQREQPVSPLPAVQVSAGSPASSCPNCGAGIKQMPRQKPKRFCCDACRRAWWNAHRDALRHRTDHSSVCLHCGGAFDNRGDRKRRYCGHPCYISARYGGDAP